MRTTSHHMSICGNRRDRNGKDGSKPSIEPDCYLYFWYGRAYSEAELTVSRQLPVRHV